MECNQASKVHRSGKTSATSLKTTSRTDVQLSGSTRRRSKGRTTTEIVTTEGRAAEGLANTDAWSGISRAGPSGSWLRARRTTSALAGRTLS